MKPIFVTTTDTVKTDVLLRNSYTDYWEMVRLAGFETCKMSEVDLEDSDAAYIFAPPGDGNVIEFVKNRERKCRFIGWQFEFPHKWSPKGPVDNMEIPDDFDEWWTSEPYVRQLLELYNPPEKAAKLKYVFFGGHPDFGKPRQDPIWDLCDLSYRQGTREHKLKIFAGNGYTLSPVSVWGQQRGEVLQRSRFGLHLHQFPMPFIAPIRFMIFASYKLPILTDYCHSPEPYEVYMDAIIHFNPNESRLMEGYEKTTEFNHELVTRIKPFHKTVLEAL